MAVIHNTTSQPTRLADRRPAHDRADGSSRWSLRPARRSLRWHASPESVATGTLAVCASSILNQSQERARTVLSMGEPCATAAPWAVTPPTSSLKSCQRFVVSAGPPGPSRRPALRAHRRADREMNRAPIGDLRQVSAVLLVGADVAGFPKRVVDEDIASRGVGPPPSEN